MKMMNRRLIIFVIILIVPIVSCGFFGAFNNPVDPLSDAYQGYMSLDLKNISVSYNYVLAATKTGPVYAWGEDDSTGRLGTGKATGSEYTPVKLKNLENASIVACGESHSLAVDAEGKLWGWGSNEYHQLGTNLNGGILPQEKFYEPVLLKENVSAADAGGNFSAAVDNEGLVSVWGSLGVSQGYDGDSFSLELSVPENLSLPGGRTTMELVCESNSVVVLASDRTIWRWGNINGTMYDVFEQVFGPVSVEHIAGCGDVYVAAESGGTLWTWGTYGTALWDGYDSYTGDLVEVPLTAAGFTSVAAGTKFGLALTNTGELYGWGDNTCGVLGLPYWMFNLDEPFRVDSFYSGFDFTGASVYAGANNAFVYLADGALFSWGGNDSGELGIGKPHAPTMALERYRVTFGETDPHIIDAAGGRAGTALDSDGNIWVWGCNDNGQLGLGDTTFRAEPEKVSSGPVITDIAAGWNFSAAKDEDGVLWGSGYNSYGQLATGDTTDSSIPVSMLTAVDIFACGSSHVVAAQGSGAGQKLYAWGGNASGQLGIGDTAKRTTPAEIVGVDSVVTEISCCGENSMVLDETGHVWVWGSNNHGQIGDGTSNNRTTPFMLPEALFDGSAVSSIEAGYESCFAITADGRLWGWGGPYYSLGYTEEYDAPDTSIPVVLIEEGVKAIAASSNFSGDSQNLIIQTLDDQVYYMDVPETLTSYEEGARISDAQGTELKIRHSDIWSGRNLSVLEAGGGHFFLINSDGILYAF